MKEEIKKFKDLNNSLKILVHLKNNLIVLLKCRKNAESKNAKVVKAKNERVILFFKM